MRTESWRNAGPSVTNMGQALSRSSRKLVAGFGAIGFKRGVAGFAVILLPNLLFL